MGREGEAADYLARALAVLSPPAPLLVAIGGLQGTGKSTLARTLAPSLGPAPGALVLRSDEIRKRLFGRAPEERLPAEAYAAEASRAVYAELVRLASETVAAGHAAIADAVFLRPEEREAIAAARGEAPFVGIWLEAPLPLLEARLAARSGDASDADVAVLRAALAHDPGPIAWRRLDAAAADLAERARALLPKP
ncbi:MAG: AAA family ATPase [Acetobacteraceae bacterium]|nr:AAA family ATPase [Acetobacteraceae bacterium]